MIFNTNKRFDSRRFNQRLTPRLFHDFGGRIVCLKISACSKTFQKLSGFSPASLPALRILSLVNLTDTETVNAAFLDQLPRELQSLVFKGKWNVDIPSAFVLPELEELILQQKSVSFVQDIFGALDQMHKLKQLNLTIYSNATSYAWSLLSVVNAWSFFPFSLRLDSYLDDGTLLYSRLHHR